MTNTASTSASAIAHDKIGRISIGQRAGIWRVALNGNFYGDYSRRYWALDAAFEKADDIAASGGAAIITWTIDGQHDALLYDTRRPAPREYAERLFQPRSGSPRRWPTFVGERFAQRPLAQVKA